MKIGRNAPCPCGSGKKYKKCCLNKSFIEVKPTNDPEIIDYHMISRDNGKTWEKVYESGPIDMTLIVSDKEDVDLEISNMFKEIFDNFQDEKFKEKIHNCKHKVYAVRYHKLAIENEIRNKVEEFRKEYNAVSGVKSMKQNHKLIYETESFLFQVKSNLDILTQSLKYVLPRVKHFHTFQTSEIEENGERVKKSGYNVIKDLRNKGYGDLADLFQKNVDLWIQDMVKMRVTITHYSPLKGFNCFIEEPYAGKEVKIHYPTMPSGERVDKYCERIYNDLINLYKDIFYLIKNIKSE